MCTKVENFGGKVDPETAGSKIDPRRASLLYTIISPFRKGSYFGITTEEAPPPYFEWKDIVALSRGSHKKSIHWGVTPLYETLKGSGVAEFTLLPLYRVFSDDFARKGSEQLVAFLSKTEFAFFSLLEPEQSLEAYRQTENEDSSIEHLTDSNGVSNQEVGGVSLHKSQKDDRELKKSSCSSAKGHKSKGLGVHEVGEGTEESAGGKVAEAAGQITTEESEQAPRGERMETCAASRSVGKASRDFWYMRGSVYCLPKHPNLYNQTRLSVSLRSLHVVVVDRHSRLYPSIVLA
mmetsp:Transcript_4224/g.8594  ORF Transcript_4224/g.8594 Transcript_4224/m.8594 type:complete len:292 (+) Transcript_4224:624-1499(+)